MDPKRVDGDKPIFINDRLSLPENEFTTKVQEKIWYGLPDLEPEYLSAMASSPLTIRRRQIAEYDHLPSACIDALCGDPDAEVRQSIAKHVNLSEENVRALKNDKAIAVIQVVTGLEDDRDRRARLFGLQHRLEEVGYRVVRRDNSSIDFACAGFPGLLVRLGSTYRVARMNSLPSARMLTVPAFVFSDVRVKWCGIFMGTKRDTYPKSTTIDPEQASLFLGLADQMNTGVRGIWMQRLRGRLYGYGICNGLDGELLLGEEHPHKGTVKCYVRGKEFGK